MKNSLVSVVVPIYKVEDYLDRCVESIVNQTYKNLEIILVDDGSPDNCPQICDRWAEKDSRIKVIHKKNAGLGMARNTGIENATGEYVCFFDSDDYVEVTLVTKCIAEAQKRQADVVVFGGSDVYENGEIKRNKLSPTAMFFEENAVVNDLLPLLFTAEMGLDISACMKMFNLNAINRHSIRFRSEREIISEDAFFILELFSKINRVAILPENLYYYYKRVGSLTQSYNENRQEKNNIFLQKSLAFACLAEYPEIVSVHIKACYHGYTIAAMKQIVNASLSKKEKRKELKKIFTSATLRQTLTRKVLRLEKRALRTFFYLVKYRCYNLCYLLLKYKVQREKV